MYEDFAKVYDLIMDEVDYYGWAKYLDEILLRYSGSESRVNVLELCCGTGSLTEKLYELGYDMCGVDSSEEMLAVAKEKLKDKSVHLFHQDIRELNLNAKFKAILCPCDGINYILSLSDLRRTFNRVSKHLEKGGLFIFDISSFYKLKEYLGDNSFCCDNDEVTYFWESSFSKNKLSIDLMIFKSEDGLYKRYDEQQIQRAYRIEEITKVITSTGFKLIEIFGDHTKSPPKDKSMRIHFVARKEV